MSTTNTSWTRYYIIDRGTRTNVYISILIISWWTWRIICLFLYIVIWTITIWWTIIYIICNCVTRSICWLWCICCSIYLPLVSCETWIIIFSYRIICTINTNWTIITCIIYSCVTSTNCWLRCICCSSKIISSPLISCK